MAQQDHLMLEAPRISGLYFELEMLKPARFFKLPQTEELTYEGGGGEGGQVAMDEDGWMGMDG